MNNAQIFLGGGGTELQSHELDAVYFSMHPDVAKILYIPIAAHPKEGMGFEIYYDWFAKLIGRHVIDKEVDFTLLSEAESIPSLDRFTSVYLGGGNTYRLLEYLQAHDGVEKITSYIKNGGMIYGGSAGAVVLGKDIRTVKEEYLGRTMSTLGLNLLREHSVLPHFTSEQQSKAKKLAKNIGSHVIGLPEDAGLILDREGNQLMSIGEVSMF